MTTPHETNAHPFEPDQQRLDDAERALLRQVPRPSRAGELLPVLALAASCAVGAAVALLAGHLVTARGAPGPEPATTAVPTPVPPALVPIALPPVMVPDPASLPISPPDAAEDAALHLIVQRGNRHFAILAPRPPLGDDEGIEIFGELAHPSGAAKPLAFTERTRRWRGRRLRVGNRCEQEVTSLIHLTLLSGSPGYAGDYPHELDRDGALDYLREHGRHYLAVELDRCHQGTWARPADRPLVRPGRKLDAPANLLARALEDLASSPAGRHAQRRYLEAGNDGSFLGEDTRDVDHLYVQHPETGARILIVHAVVDYSCGGAGINLLAVYQVEGETLHRQHVTEAGELMHLEDAMDTDNDGDFELVGTSYLGGPSLHDARGAELLEVEIPFYGCPC